MQDAQAEVPVQGDYFESAKSDNIITWQVEQKLCFISKAQVFLRMALTRRILHDTSLAPFWKLQNSKFLVTKIECVTCHLAENRRKEWLLELYCEPEAFADVPKAHAKHRVIPAVQKLSISKDNKAWWSCSSLSWDNHEIIHFLVRAKEHPSVVSRIQFDKKKKMKC